MNPEPLVAGGIEDHRSAIELAHALDEAGVRASVSQAGVLRVPAGVRRYEFYGESGEYILADPCADSVTDAQEDLAALLPVFERIGMRCRFEVYQGEEMVSYHHVKWPSEGSIER
jgi:hypothetical protein